MKEIPKKYQCEYCKKVSENKEEILSCEITHKEEQEAKQKAKEEFEKSAEGVKLAYENYVQLKKEHNERYVFGHKADSVCNDEHISDFIKALFR